MSLSDLYKQVILEHNKHPKNFGELKDATNTGEGYNPLCGDHYWVDLKLDDENIIDIKFRGEGCAISKAAASIMTTNVKESSKQSALELAKMFQSSLIESVNKDLPATLDVLLGVKNFPMRIKCATLPWHTLISAMQNKETISTE